MQLNYCCSITARVLYTYFPQSLLGVGCLTAAVVVHDSFTNDRADNVATAPIVSTVAVTVNMLIFANAAAGKKVHIC